MASEVIARHLPVRDKHVRPTMADKLDHVVGLAHIVPQRRSSAESANQQGLVDLRTKANYKKHC